MALICHDVSKMFYTNEKCEETQGRDRQPLLTRVKNRFWGSSKTIWAVKDVSFHVKRGEIFGLLGPNGSGKSTLIRMIATLLLPDQGHIKVFGHDVFENPRYVRERINRVSAEASFFKKLSAWENLSYAARLYRLDLEAAREEALHILNRLGLEKGKLDESLETFSRGMQQKVAIARALLTSPILLLLDEPTTGLDPQSKRDVQSFIRDIHSTHDSTILLTSHDMNEVDDLCDRVALLKNGNLVAVGTPEELKERFLHDRSKTMEDVFLTATGDGEEGERHG